MLVIGNLVRSLISAYTPCTSDVQRSAASACNSVALLQFCTFCRAGSCAVAARTAHYCLHAQLQLRLDLGPHTLLIPASAECSRFALDKHKALVCRTLVGLRRVDRGQAGFGRHSGLGAGQCWATKSRLRMSSHQCQTVHQVETMRLRKHACGSWSID